LKTSALQRILARIGSHVSPIFATMFSDGPEGSAGALPRAAVGGQGFKWRGTARWRLLSGGYAVECALKACIAKETQRYEFPEKKRVYASYTHNFKDLVRVARLQGSLEQRPRAIRYFGNTGMTCNHGRSRAVMAGILREAHACLSKPSATEIMES
jgi:hypothetical protein